MDVLLYDRKNIFFTVHSFQNADLNTEQEDIQWCVYWEEGLGVLDSPPHPRTKK